jgi:anti-sigma factor RsiW
MVMLTCLRARRRIGAYLDGALEGEAAQAIARHLSECRTCQGDAEALRRVGAMLQRSAASPPPEPDWTGFWPGIVRGVEAARRAPRPSAAPRSWSRERDRWWRPRWALGVGVVAGALLSLTLWQTMPGSRAPDAPIVVSSAHTEDPRGTVMVYSTHDKDVTVVWVLGLDDTSD